MFWTNVKYLDAHILKQNEQLKYENPTEENKLKIKALQLERKDLQAQYRKKKKKMNDDIESVGLKGEFSVLSDDLYYYDLFFDSDYEIEQNVRKYYFGK